ncbi:MAG: alkaline phosphatase family protein [Sutterella wadsworthensis]
MSVDKLAVIVITDGLRRDSIEAQSTPALDVLRGESVWLRRHRSAAPSVTRVCSATIATGCYPLRHELAGNKLCLLDHGKLRLLDVGVPSFFSLCRELRGHVLGVPTLAQRTEAAGGLRMYGNASPGAAYVQDPTHRGHVFHRAGSFGPRGELPQTEALNVSSDLAGDRAMTERFIDDLENQLAAVNLLWLGHPDTTQHHCPLGSPEHLEALRRTDENVSAVYACVDELRRKGKDVLFIAGSDHGHETVSGLVDIDKQLAEAGFESELASGRLVTAPNGTAALVYLQAPAVRARLEAFFRQADWLSDVVCRRQFELYGISQAPALECFLSLKSDPAALNPYGVAGESLACLVPGSPYPIGCGQHGGFGLHEQSPYCLVNHPGLRPSEISAVTDLTLIAPTVLRFLGLSLDGLDGRSLQQILGVPTLGD